MAVAASWWREAPALRVSLRKMCELTSGFRLAFSFGVVAAGGDIEAAQRVKTGWRDYTHQYMQPEGWFPTTPKC